MRRVAAVIAALLLTAFNPPGSEGHATTYAPDLQNPPNIVLILTDDMRFDEISRMPFVESDLVGKGVTFSNAFVTNPLCCPSRATIQTGNYSHTTQVYSNHGSDGGWGVFHATGDDRSTIATWLHQGPVNYRTAMIGKYMNGYLARNASFVPPGWNRWVAWAPLHDEAEAGGGYYNYPLSVNGTLKQYGSTTADYSTDVYASYARSFINRTPPSRPLFLYFATRAPHGPSTPPARYLDACPGVTMSQYPDSAEADVSDKPPYIQARPIPAPNAGDTQALKHCQSLLAVDDAVRTIFTALQKTGRLQNTMVVFMSDNGLLLGEHRWFGKKVPYEESIHVPFVVRYDPLTQGVPTTDPHLIVNTDLAPTWAQLAGVTPPTTDGTSFLPLLDGTATSWRTDFLIEHADDPADVEVPTYCGVRSEQYMYAKYSDGFEELYDLRSDPFELQNVASEPDYAAVRAKLYARMLELCDPPPPGYVP
jgi:arylsulfatase A-like enzyme